MYEALSAEMCASVEENGSSDEALYYLRGVAVQVGLVYRPCFP
jgi:hypothetical protein